VIAVRVPDEAHITWVAKEVGSDHAPRTWFGRGARQTSRRALAYRSAVDREETAAHDLQHHYALGPTVNLLTE
jgi:hypothetical protein